MNPWQECAQRVCKSLQGVLGAGFVVSILSQEGRQATIYIASNGSEALPTLPEKFDITFMRGVQEAIVLKDVLARGIAFTVVLAPKQFGIRTDRKANTFRARLP